MASETQAASGYSSVPRTDDNGGVWSAGGTLDTIDSNYATQTPYKNDPPPMAIPLRLLGCNASGLIVTFGAFSLPPTDVIVTATVIVVHKQGQTGTISGTITFENDGTTLSSTSDITTNLWVDPSSLSIAALNAGSATATLLYKGNGETALPIDIPVPYPAVNYVALQVTTAASGSISYINLKKRSGVTGGIGVK